MNLDKLKANKLSDRGLVTRKIFASSQVPPRSLVLPLIFLSLFIFFFYWFYSGLTQQQENLNQINSRLISIEESVLNQNNSLYRIFYNDINFQYEQLDIEIPTGFKKIIFDQSGFLWGINGSYVYSQKTNFNPIPIRKSINYLI